VAVDVVGVTGSPGAIVLTSGAVRDLNHHRGEEVVVADALAAALLLLLDGGTRVTLEAVVRDSMARWRAITSNRAVACLLLAIHDLL
jgi:hypothetical protein